MVTEKLAALLLSVTRGTAEVTLPDLFTILDLPPEESTLGKIAMAKQQLVALGLDLIPEVTSGEINTVRRLILPDATKVARETMLSEMCEPESARLELKSSLLYDHKRAMHDRNATGKDLRSEEVLHST